jgi:glutamyl-Q tRNA(Asp) synthetase
VRFRASGGETSFVDLVRGPYSQDVAKSVGDFIVRRADGIASYQLAVVVDDAWQGVTRVVRGADLLSSTPWQMELQDALDLPRPIYGHLPLLTESGGEKLAKSRRSVPIPGGRDLTGPAGAATAAAALISTLTYLSQAPPPELAHGSIKDVWNWAVAHWRPQALAGRTRVELSAPGDT